jgi:hypothetical protein
VSGASTLRFAAQTTTPDPLIVLATPSVVGAFAATVVRYTSSRTELFAAVLPTQASRPVSGTSRSPTVHASKWQPVTAANEFVCSESPGPSEDRNSQEWNWQFDPVQKTAGFGPVPTLPPAYRTWSRVATLASDVGA